MKQRRVLVMEDEPMIAMLLAELLTEMGADVCAVEGTEAGGVAAAARCAPHLMIVDDKLGQGSGVSAVEQILRGGFVPHVFVSGNTLRDRRLDPRAVVIQKPFTNKVLSRAINQVLGATVC